MEHRKSAIPTSAATSDGQELSASLIFRQADRPDVVKNVLRPTTVIGSGENCNIRLQAQGVLPVHAVLTLDDGVLRLRDVGSRLGTLVNGARIQRHCLADGDEIRVGPFTFSLEAQLPPAPAAGENADEDPQGATALAHQGHFARMVHAGRTHADGTCERLEKNLLRETTLCGSARGCSVQLAADEIEPIHCLVTLDGGVLRMRDLRSRSGTWLNDERVVVEALKHGDRIRVGGFHFEVESSLGEGGAPPNAPEQVGPEQVGPEQVGPEQVASGGRPASLGNAPADTGQAGSSLAPTGISDELRPETDEKLRHRELEQLEAALAAELGRQPESAGDVATKDSGRLRSVWTSLSRYFSLLKIERKSLERERAELTRFRREMVAAEGVAASAAPAVQPAPVVVPRPVVPHRGTATDSQESADDARCARALLQRGAITEFQAEWFLHDRLPEVRIDQYRLRSLIDVGGMGWVYAAEDTETGQTVALKVLFQHYVDNPELRMRFDLEARAGIRLRHPQIVRMDAARHSGSLCYIVMEFIEGINLHEVAALYGPTPWPLASELIRQTALALECAHRIGMVHRDIKPANLLLDHEGRIRILDFGLALLPDDADEQLLAERYGQRCLGTADFIAPEQSVDSFHVDGRADLYSLGCTMYFALTAELPFPSGSNARKLEAHREQQPRPVSQFAPDVPEEVLAIRERMTAKQPDRRFASASEVAAALEKFAKPARLEFDYEGILYARARNARRRLRRMAAS